jgi:carboxypeptidase C (cathepsin A)
MRAQLILLAAFAALAVLAQNSDLIKNLPYYNGPSLARQYSGYLTVNTTNGRAFHYWFVEAQRNPSNSPLVLWLNGGPGCSSLDGFFYEHGPVIFDDSTDDLKLIPRPYSWNRLANILYLESPAGVGFSYSNTSSDYTANSDTQTAADNYNAIQAFLAKYPQYRNNDFYISGESYAGVYVPSTAVAVVTGNQQGNPQINLKGIMVGNGVTDPFADSPLVALIPFLYGHGVFSTKVMNQINQYCNNSNDPNCQNAVNTVYNLMDDIDIYDIYSECYHQRPSDDRTPGGSFMSKKPISKRSPMLVPPCTDADKATRYLNKPEVQNALHVASQNIEWSICSEVVNSNYNSDILQNSLVPYHQKLLQNNVRVLIFSGDTDAAVPYTGTEYWTSNLMGLAEKNTWRQWFYDNNQQVGGMVTEYVHSFYFLTVKGAGHMVPQFKPAPAFAMFERFLNDQPF